MKRVVLITGGAGFIGCELGRLLVTAGDEVHVLDNLHPQVHPTKDRPARLHADVELHVGDVTDAPTWRALLSRVKPELVVHLAAETGTGQSLTHAARHAGVNVLGTAVMLDELNASGHRPRQLLVASSRAVYGDGAWRDDAGAVFYPTGRTRQDLEAKKWDPAVPGGGRSTPLPNVAGRTAPNPVSIYGVTKLAQEQLMASWCRAFGVGLSVLRLQNVYGAGQAVGNPYTGVLTFFAQQANRKEVISVYEDGVIIRDFVHVTDVARAMVTALSLGDASVRCLDIGSGKAITIHEVARKMANLAGAPAPQVTGQFRDGDVRSAWCEIDAARQLLDFKPQVTLDEGLAGLLEFAKSAV
jgi:dTDP-L-rhamnose 4-epimerase